MRTQADINRASLKKHLMNALTVAICTREGSVEMVKAIEEAMEMIE